MFVRIILLISIPSLLTYKIEKGKEYDASGYAVQGEKGDKGYSRHHYTENGAKGHQDKENHQKKYAENEGHKNGYDHRDGYYADQHQGHKTKKGYHYEDHGKYAKGHSTKGHHNIHKLDEYKKNTDFFDENNDEAFKEKHGGYEISEAVANGGYHKGEHQNKGHDEGKYGKSGLNVHGSHYLNNKGHKNAEGHDAYFGNYADFAKKKSNDAVKNYGYVVKHHN